MSYFKTLFWALAFAATTIGVTVEHSLDDQLPLVARVDSPYDWTFSAQTFGSCDNISQYTISSLPIWLQFDAALRRFHGTPSLKDVGAPEITVTAHGCNATAHSWFNILVTTEKPPVLHLPIAQQFNTSNPSLSSVFIVGPDSLRVPPKWSFSIGFEGKTFFSESKLFYDVLQSDGSGLPKWMKFDQSGITLDGYSPSEENTLYHLALHVSDQHGYTASTIPFTLIISSHDLSIPYPMPTVNVTSNNAFSFIFDSPTDFSGILVDGQPIQPGNISSLSIDTTTASDWLSYDEKTRTLTGTTSEDGENAFLPVKIQTDSNRTIDTNVTIAPVPSYFTYDPLPAFLLGSDRMVEVPIGQYFANNSGDTQATLSATFDPLESANFLTFDSSAARVTGLVPESFPGTFIAVNITAYTNTTHSTSHTSLPIALTSDELMKHPTGPPDSQASGRKPNKKLIMGLGIAFGVVGGICALLCLLALTRRLARAKDTAGKDEEAQKVLSEKDRMWYGLESGRSSTEGGYGKKGAGIASPVASITAPKTPANTVRYGNVGIRPVAAQTTGGSTQMSKREFVSRLRDTVRKVSDQYKRRKPLILNKTPMTIGNPSLIHRTSESSSIPVPTGPNPTPIQSKVPLSRYSSNASIESDTSVRTHAAEAVISTAKAMSVHSASGISRKVQPSPMPRPRLVPFTSASRVPLPHSPTSSTDSGNGTPERQLSQRAKVIKGGEAHSSGDELSVGYHYVQALGANPTEAAPSTFTVSTNMRSSFSSLQSDPRSSLSDGTFKTVIRAGERFKFSIPLKVSSGQVSQMEARLSSGRMLPHFLHVDFSSRRSVAEMYGVPSTEDVGELDIIIYDGNMWAAQVSLQVI